MADQKFIELESYVKDDLTELILKGSRKDFDVIVSDCINLQGVKVYFGDKKKTVDGIRAFRNTVVKLCNDLAIENDGQVKDRAIEVSMIATSLIDKIIRTFGGEV